MDNYFQTKENLKTEDNISDFGEETIKNDMPKNEQNRIIDGDIDSVQGENIETAQGDNMGDIQGDIQDNQEAAEEIKTVEIEGENSVENGVAEEHIEPLNGENLQEKADEFVLNNAEAGGVDNVEIAEENRAEVKTENLDERETKSQNETENFDENTAGNSAEAATKNPVYTMPSENYFMPKSGENIATLNKTQKQPATKKMPFVFSMLGLLLSIFYIGLPFAITGLVMTIMQKNKGETDEMTKTSFILSFAGIAVGLFTLILFVFCLIF